MADYVSLSSSSSLSSESFPILFSAPSLVELCAPLPGCIYRLSNSRLKKCAVILFKVTSGEMSCSNSVSPLMLIFGRNKSKKKYREKISRFFKSEILYQNQGNFTLQLPIAPNFRFKFIDA